MPTGNLVDRGLECAETRVEVLGFADRFAPSEPRFLDVRESCTRVDAALVGVPSRSRAASGTPSMSLIGSSDGLSARGRLVEGAEASLEIDRERVQTEEIASEETVESTADEARELLGIEAERAGRELVILPGPVGRLRVGEAHRGAGVEQEAPTRIGDEVSVEEFESQLGHPSSVRPVDAESPGVQAFPEGSLGLLGVRSIRELRLWVDETLPQMQAVVLNPPPARVDSAFVLVEPFLRRLGRLSDVHGNAVARFSRAFRLPVGARCSVQLDHIENVCPTLPTVRVAVLRHQPVRRDRVANTLDPLARREGRTGMPSARSQHDPPDVSMRTRTSDCGKQPG